MGKISTITQESMIPLLFIFLYFSVSAPRAKRNLFEYLRKIDTHWGDIFEKTTYGYSSLNKLYGASTIRPECNPSALLILANHRNILDRYKSDKLVERYLVKVYIHTLAQILTGFLLITGLFLYK